MKIWSILMKIFLELLTNYCYDWKFFLLFWDSCRCFEPIWKKKTENLKKISKNLQFLKFHLWVCGRNFGRSAENSVKNIFLPKILTKIILSKIRPLHHQNIQKVDPPPPKKKKWPLFFLGGGSHFICDLSQ